MARRWGQSFDRRYLLRPDIGDCNTAGPHRRAIHVNRAGATLLKAASEFRAGQSDCIANNPEKGHVGTDIDVVLLSVYCQGNHVGIAPLDPKEFIPVSYTHL